MRQALELALEALQVATTPLAKDRQEVLRAITAIKEALAQPEEEKLHPVHIGVDVTREGTAVTAFYRKPDAVMEMFYSQFHPLAQPEQEPVAVVDVHEFYDNCANFSLLQKLPKGKHTLYTAPPQRTWVGLTDEEIADCAEKMEASDPTDSFWREFFRGIEAKLKEKNT